MKRSIITALLATMIFSLGLFASCSVKESALSNEDITVEDLGDYKEIAYVWMNEWLDMHKSLPNRDVAQITDGAIDDLQVLLVSKAGEPRAFVFSADISIQPTKPIGTSSYWMAGNTHPSPDRDSSWGQMYREIELELLDDGLFHFVEMGTGGVGHSKGYIEAP